MKKFDELLSELIESTEAASVAVLCNDIINARKLLERCAEITKLMTGIEYYGEY